MDKPHRKLKVWQKSIDFLVKVYRVTSKFPDFELYALTSQLRRAALSVPSNIAEGAARKSPKEFLQFLSVARGSISEMDTHLEVALRLGYLTASACQELNSNLTEIDKLLAGLIRSVR